MREKIGNITPVHTTESFNINLFKGIIDTIKRGHKEVRKEGISKLLQLEGLIIHYEHKVTQRKILSDSEKLDYPHEQHTSVKLTGVDYDVLFVPKGLFKRNEKKFDVFLAKDHILLESDLNAFPLLIRIQLETGSKKVVNKLKDWF